MFVSSRYSKVNMVRSTNAAERKTLSAILQIALGSESSTVEMGIRRDAKVQNFVVVFWREPSARRTTSDLVVLTKVRTHNHRRSLKRRPSVILQQ